jgi:SAM-dependent methyltransferase
MDDQQAALEHVSRAWDWFSGMVALSATNLGIELRLFDALQEAGALAPKELAQTLGLQERPVETWARTLVHYGLLEARNGGKVAMSPGVELMVCEPRTLLNLAPSFAYHARFLARDFLDLPQFFKDGAPIAPIRHGEDLTRNIADQTAAMHSIFVSNILPELREVEALLLAGGTVLDAGCGVGNLGLLLCTTYPEMHYVGLDLDEVAIEEGQRAILGMGLRDRMQIERRPVAEAQQARADVALLFLSLHEIAELERPAALSALKRALRPGGILLVFDETYPETLGDAASRQARMGLHFEYTEMLWGSSVPTEREIVQLLTEADFRQIERRSVLDGSFDVVVARSE